MCVCLRGGFVFIGGEGGERGRYLDSGGVWKRGFGKPKRGVGFLTLTNKAESNI